MTKKSEIFNTVYRLLKLMHSFDKDLIPLSLLCAIFSGITPYLAIFMSGLLLDNLHSKNYELAFYIVIFFSTLIFILSYLKEYFQKIRCKKNNCNEPKFAAFIRDKMLSYKYEKIQSPQVYQKLVLLERMINISGGVDALVAKLIIFLKGLISSLISFIMIIYLCLTLPQSDNQVLSFIASPIVSTLIICSFIALTLMIIIPKNRKFNQALQDLLQIQGKSELAITSIITDILQNYKVGATTRIYDMGDMLKQRLMDVNENDIIKCHKMFADYITNLAVFHSISKSAIIVVAYFIILVKILSNAITIGMFTTYGLMITFFTSTLMDTLSSYTTICSISNYLKYYLEILDWKECEESGSIPIEKRLDNEYEIEFKDVCFHYPDTDVEVLKNINFKLNLKEKMAIVGKNGAGKSTFIHLLVRLYKPTSGMITLNGIDIQKYDYSEYISLFSVVFQQFKMFAFSIKENVTTTKNCDEKKLREVLTQAGIMERIDELEQGVDTFLMKYNEDGVEFSGGEMQKLAIARALYKDAPYVILDEPTAALDPVSEYEIYKGFDAMVQDKTSIYISHRMSSCRFCPNIIVFDMGEIVETGSHDDLLKLDGVYSTMWNAQAQYYE